MKKVIFGIILALSFMVFMGSTALALGLQLPNGKIIQDLPDNAGNAGNSGTIIYPCEPPFCGI